MIIARLAVLRAIAAMLSVTLGASAAPAAEADRIDVRIEIFGFAGFHVLTNRTSVEASTDRYAIAMDLDTRGIASIFVDLTSHSEVRGRIIRDAAHPDGYHGDVRRNGVDRHYRVDYRADGTVVSESTPPSTLQRNSIAMEQIRGTVDQLTAYFILERQLARRGTCATIIPVFDGRDRYNLRFTDAQPETLPADGHHRFAGPTQVCGVTREEIGGFSTDRAQTEEGYRGGKIWYARLVAGEQMVPVRMEFETEFGAVEGYLAELHGRGVNLRFMD